MATSLITPYEYAQYFSLSSFDATAIQLLLDYSTALIQTYCDRSFEKADYKEWHYDVGDFVTTAEYPINRLYFVKPLKSIATINTANTASEQMFEKDSQNIYVTLDGVVNTYPLSTYTTIGSLSSELALSGIDIVLSNITATYPTTYIENVTNNLEDVYLMGADLKNIQAKIDKQAKRSINFDNYILDDVLVSYNAGYTFSVDTSGHDALNVVGNVPADLKNVAINLTKDIAAVTNVSYNANGTPSLLFQSETIGDYSYNRGGSGFQASYFLNKYVANEENGGISVLDFYRKKSF